VILEKSEAVSVSYPNFFDDLDALVSDKKWKISF
jgi:5-enolpyruvylshikimate-3-phosphate synthase